MSMFSGQDLILVLVSIMAEAHVSMMMFLLTCCRACQKGVFKGKMIFKRRD